MIRESNVVVYRFLVVIQCIRQMCLKCLSLVQRVKAECEGKDIWMWTGYELDELDEKQKQVLEYVDTLIDGRFEQDKADPMLDWRGSSNQIIHRFRL